MPKQKKQKAKQALAQHSIYLVEVVEGLEAITRQEIKAKIPSAGVIRKELGEIIIACGGPEISLWKLKTALSVYHVLEFAIPRPKALLGHEHFTRLVTAIDGIIRQWDAPCQSWHLAAAGSHTRVMQRIIEAVSEHLRISHDANEGDLTIRLRPDPSTEASVWQALIRLTPRPLATRDWRVANMPGALNASVAAALPHLVKSTADDRFLNIACGSGTILIERLRASSAQVAIGVDIDHDALAVSSENIGAAQAPVTGLIQANAIDLPFAYASFTSVMADLPFGQLVGSHEENIWLYPAILTEAARITQPGSYFVIVTHEVKLMQECLAATAQWHLQQEIKINLTGLHPRIYVLQRI